MSNQAFIRWVGIFWLTLHLNLQAEWLTDYQAALAQASAENKTVLLDFTGSDWCGWCKRLKREVFDRPEFAGYAQSKLVLVEVDFPKGKEQSAELKAANEALANKFGISGFPTIILVNGDGKRLAQTGYEQGGPVNYVVHLQKLLGQPIDPPAVQEQSPPEPPVKEETPPPAKPVAPTPIRWGPTPPPTRFTELTLKGIVGSKSRRIALINDKTFLTGDKIRMKIADKIVQITCNEIREDSVLLTIEGSPNVTELKLKDFSAAGKSINKGNSVKETQSLPARPPAAK